MKSMIVIVLGGLLFAGTAKAAEPAPQQNASVPAAAGLKIGIDAKTGKRRQLTSEESAALDAKAAAKSRTLAKGARPMAKGLLNPPATFEESAAAGVSRGGLTGYVAPLESYSAITATVGADGKLTLLEDGVPMGQAREMASE